MKHLHFLLTTLFLFATLASCASTKDELALTDDTENPSATSDELTNNLESSDNPAAASTEEKGDENENLNFAEDENPEKSAAIKRKLPPPGKGGKQPFPKSFNLFEFEKYMQLNKGLYVRYIPLEKEYDLYYKTVNDAADVDDEARLSVKNRVGENDEKAHWVFMYAINELLHFMHENSRRMLRVDLEDNFVTRMKVISETAVAFRDSKKNTRYIDFARSLYISINDRYFGRQVKPRQTD